MGFECDPDSVLDNWGTDVSVWFWLVSGETLLQVTNFTSHRWDLNPDLAGNMAIAAGMLNHCTTRPPYWKIYWHFSGFAASITEVWQLPNNLPLCLTERIRKSQLCNTENWAMHVQCSPLNSNSGGTAKFVLIF